MHRFTAGTRYLCAMLQLSFAGILVRLSVFCSFLCIHVYLNALTQPGGHTCALHTVQDRTAIIHCNKSIEGGAKSTPGILDKKVFQNKNANTPVTW